MSPFHSTSIRGVATDHSKQTKHPAELGERTEKAEDKGLEAVEMAQREDLSLDFRTHVKATAHGKSLSSQCWEVTGRSLGGSLAGQWNL